MSPLLDPLSLLTRWLDPFRLGLFDAPAALLSVCFAVALVIWLVLAEEAELRRSADPAT